MGAPQKRATAERYARLRLIGCLCCRLNQLQGRAVTGQWPEIHHLNAGGQPGSARRGDRFTIPLCAWHHRGVGPTRNTDAYGPSFARGTKPFREVYGSDDDLLALADRLIAGYAEAA